MKNTKTTLAIVAASIGFMSYSLSAQETIKRNSNPVKTQQEMDAHKKVNENDKSIQKSKDQNRTDTMNVGYMSTDHIAMEDGKMVAIMDGKIIPMDQEVTMKNGTKCMTDGTCLLTDGKKIIMKNGDKMDLNGVMMPKDRTPKRAN